MAGKDAQPTSEIISIDDLTKRWRNTFQKIAYMDGKSGIATVATKWNKLNPFLQNQRIKDLYTRAKSYSKANIGEFLESPGNHERELRSLAWANSSSQQIYYNILRRACDIPIYNYFTIPDLLEGDYGREDFQQEDRLVQNWLETFDVPLTCKTMALEVKREGKSSYLLRNKFIGQGKNKTTAFCTLQKMPTDWIKITGKGQLGYTISFDMMYFLNIANSPSDFGDFMEAAWADIIENGVVEQDVQTKKYQLNLERAANYKFSYEGETYISAIEGMKNGRQMNYMFWLRMPYDICFTFGSDNSHPWVAPDTMGLMLKLQELTDYGQLAGLIASTPLTAVLTGEIEVIQQPRAGKNESVFSPEVLQGYMQQFNEATSTNVEAWMWPAKNIKLQQLSADVNSSDIISTATSNFLESAGEGGLTIATDKPNVAQITVAKQLAASQQRYVTLQFEQVLNFILQHKLGLKYVWKIRIWGDIFNNENDKKYLKEIVANGNIALFPKLMSAEGISMRDTKAITEYIKQFKFYDEFVTYTQLKSAELGQKMAEEKAQGSVGRPMIEDGNIENDATAKSREEGTNTSDNREQG
ncbi:MAG: hypothetical protein J6S67_07505 [Methanobrevibacter sp.]|nr:hypothetical protein [Methanobrevibacter sp.]